MESRDLVVQFNCQGILRIEIEWHGKKVTCCRYIAENFLRAHVDGVFGRVKREIESWMSSGQVSDVGDADYRKVVADQSGAFQSYAIPKASETDFR